MTTKLRKLRLAAGLTQTRLSELSSVHQPQISVLEANGCRRYSLATIRLALALGCEPADLLECTDSGPASPGPAVTVGNGASHA